jgi:hypothetical protein
MIIICCIPFAMLLLLPAPVLPMPVPPIRHRHQSVTATNAAFVPLFFACLCCRQIMPKQEHACLTASQLGCYSNML